MNSERIETELKNSQGEWEGGMDPFADELEKVKVDLPRSKSLQLPGA